jgi:hypothetical protein
MDLLKQTSLILGLASLSLGGWSLFRDWRNKVSILFSFLCLIVSVWALSFVSHATILGRLSYDIHLFCNVMLSPVVILLISKILSQKENLISKVLFWISLAGAIVLNYMILFSLGAGEGFRRILEFWPTLIFIEYVHVMILDYGTSFRMESETVKPSQKFIIYLGLGLALTFCTFDHIPSMGYTLPALGNVLVTIYLAATIQIVNPQRLLGVESLVSRLFAVLILSLVITGFFALMYSYISQTFSLFLLNSFLISFAVLALWSPLVTFFRFLARRTFRSQSDENQALIDGFKLAITAATHEVQLRAVIQDFFKTAMNAADTQIVTDISGIRVPLAVSKYLEDLESRGLTPVLHREILQKERELVLTHEQKRDLDLLLQFLNVYRCNVIFPAFQQKKIIALVLVRAEATEDEVAMGFSAYVKIYEVMTDLAASVARLAQIEAAKEKDRLILLGEMAAGLAHEVRNPLGAIRGAAELMDESSSPWAKVIRDEVGRLNRLVSQFLDFSQNPKENREVLDLNEVIELSLRNIKLALPKEVEVSFQKSEASVPVKIVPDSLQQILHNLIQNGLKAQSGKQNPVIEVEVFSSGFVVRDQGVGMSDETLSKVLQPFFTSFKDGTGLGLSICERLIHFDQGRLMISSVLGKGTEVRVEYPDAG